jgi:hypothetical protein
MYPVEQTVTADILPIVSDDEPGDLTQLIYYKLDRWWSGDATIMADHSGRGNHGAKLGAASIVTPGHTGDGALSMSADGDGLSWNDYEPLFAVDVDKVVMDFYFRTAVRSRDVMVARGKRWGWIKCEMENGQPRFAVYYSSLDATRATSPDRYDDGDWHHFRGEMDRPAGEVRLYIDDVLMAIESHPDSSLYDDSDDDYTSQLGHDKTFSGAVSRQFQGDIDEFKLYIG